MKECRKKLIKDNKGFSLVELIVVMAIMAILVGAIAPQVIKYVEKARESKDIEIENNIFTAVQTGIAQSAGTVGTFTVHTINNTTDTNYKLIESTVIELSGYTQNSDIKLKSKAATQSHTVTPAVGSTPAVTDTFTISYNQSTGLISVQIGTLTPVTNQ